MNSKPKTRVRKVRKLSRFLCQELLYDFISGRLDDERAQAVKDYLYKDADAQIDLESFDKALDYLEELSKTEPSESLHTYFVDHKGLAERVFEVVKWRNWPDALKWTFEAILVSSAVAAVWVTVPWAKMVGVLPNGQQELVRVERPKSSNPVVSTEELNTAQDSIEPELVLTADKASGAEAKLQAQAIIAKSITAPVVAAQTPAPIEKPKVSTNVQNSMEIAKAVKAKNKATDYKGMLYRGFMKIPDPKGATPKLVTRIEELGGKKAGEVKLGWEKKSGNYFHFSLPESNYETLLNDLRQYGPVRIYKDPHWRVMPEGKIRFILMIEESSSVNK